MKRNLIQTIAVAACLLIMALACGKNFSSAPHTSDLSATQAVSHVALAGAPSDVARGMLRAMITNVKGATMHKYDAHDNAGHSLDCIKIIANPYVSGQFIGVSHASFNGVLKVNLAVSTDLVNWTWVRELAGSNNGQASQPAIAVASDGGFVLAWEQEPNNHIKVVYFSNWANLQAGIVAKSYDCPRTLSSCAEGTPNLYSASSTRCDIGFHYYSGCTVDRQARGTLRNFNSWTASAQSNVDNAMLHWGVKGNIGDRDGYTNYMGYNFGVFEGQYTAGDWASWRTFLYDYQTGNADTTIISTDGGSVAFANPTITKTQLNGQNIMLVTLFIPSEGAAREEAGELIYYNKY